MDHPKYQILSIIAIILTLLAFSRLVLRSHITKDTEHLSYTWILLVLSAQTLLLIYGLINKIQLIYIPASVLIMGVIYILYIKINYNNNEIETELKKKNILL